MNLPGSSAGQSTFRDSQGQLDVLGRRLVPMLHSSGASDHGSKVRLSGVWGGEIGSKDVGMAKEAEMGGKGSRSGGSLR